MSTMNEAKGYVLGPRARVTTLRRHDGYAVAVVLHEGPFDRETAERMASEERARNSGLLTKEQAAQMLGVTVKGVDYLRREERLVSSLDESRRVMITSESVEAELARRNG